MDAMLRGLRLARELSETKAFTDLYAGELIPGPEVITIDQQRDFLRRATHSAAHPAGTCRIGTDESSVVDASLRVHGIERLRVADAAVMPSVIGANINATVLAIAEKAADLITARNQIGPGSTRERCQVTRDGRSPPLRFSGQARERLYIPRGRDRDSCLLGRAAPAA